MSGMHCAFAPHPALGPTSRRRKATVFSWPERRSDSSPTSRGHCFPLVATGRCTSPLRLAIPC